MKPEWNKMVSGVSSDALFSALAQQPAQMDTLAQSALSSGLAFYQEGKYDNAVREFKRAISLSPQSDNAVTAYDYLATAYLKQGNNKEAIKAYQSALRLSPNRDDLYNKLGNILLEEGNPDQAIRSYQSALRIAPHSTNYFYSLGEAYLAKGSVEDAKSQFQKIIQFSPEEYGGYYGLGQAYYKAGEYEKAVEQFEKVVNLKEDFLYARADLGYALTDLGRIEDAYGQAKILQDKGSSLSATLNTYIYQKAKPEFLIAYSDTGFNTTLGPRTPVSALDSYLSSPNASAEITMKFIFNKKMDIATVENPYNWQITRATPQIKGGSYNWGMPISANEINISLFPERVNYDFQNNTAVVTFRLTQNGLGNGTLDPSHIVFQFLGKDAYENTMNPSADQYSGISKIV
jgi:Tfp pilus assembly protein PilF